MERVKIDIQNHIAVVTFNRPEKRNALDSHQFEAIIKAGEQLKKNTSVRAVVLTGAGAVFCAGLDLSNFKGGGLPDDGHPISVRTYGIANKWQQVVWVWRALAVPVIAAVHGAAFGGGLQIMLGADIKYIKPDTKLSIMEMKWGLIPDMAGTQLMRHAVRDDIIRELTYTNRLFSGTDAVQYGFATHLSDNPLEDAMKLAAEIASKSPTAIVKAKKILNAAPYLTSAEGLLMESVEQEDLMKNENQLEAVMSSMQKRPGNFKDYRE
ncbi:MAG: crotonase/enoyl-CoA hydratase family protein [Saprospiraceae bacterium]